MRRRAFIAALGGAAVFSLAFTSKQKGCGMNARARLIGAWELIDGKLLTEGKATDYEFAPQSGGGGILIYSTNGYMSATLSKRERPAFATDQLDGGTEEEKVRAYCNLHRLHSQFRGQ